MNSSTITAVSTPKGTGGIAVIRLSGPDAFSIADKVWKGSPLSEAASHTAHLGFILDSDGSVLDQAVATVFADNRSFTGEPTVEFSVHGSPWIQRRVIERLIEAGASAASAGEFTQRAFLNGRLDLAQAEAVADMIAASSKAAQRMAANQMRGNFSRRLNELRDAMINIASLLELELDFSEEDVEFADRSRLLDMTRDAKREISSLAESFHAGRALKEGVAVAIVGRPNAGKSTLLNLLLQDDKAIVSDIPGTTRDIIEDTVELNGILFRFIDTAGLRHTSDDIERIGVDRARDAAAKADIILWLRDSTEILSSSKISDLNTAPTQTSNTAYPGKSSVDSTQNSSRDYSEEILLKDIPENIPVIKVLTKSDLTPTSNPAPISGEENRISSDQSSNPSSIPGKEIRISYIQSSNPSSIPGEEIRISAITGEGIDRLISSLTGIVTDGTNPEADLIVTNARHYESLTSAARALSRVETNLLSGLPSDLTAQDLRVAIHHLGQITGAITPDSLLHTIFSRFCVGK